MKLQNIIITEELKMKTRDETINSLFEKTLPQVFSPIMIKKIDRVFDGVIEPTEYSEKTTVVAYTKGNKIYVNTKNFYSIEPDKAIIYVLHEFCHLLQNQKAFYDLKKVNNDLYYCAMPYLRIWKVSKFQKYEKLQLNLITSLELLSQCLEVVVLVKKMILKCYLILLVM